MILLVPRSPQKRHSMPTPAGIPRCARNDKRRPLCLSFRAQRGIPGPIHANLCKASLKARLQGTCLESRHRPERSEFFTDRSLRSSLLNCQPTRPTGAVSEKPAGMECRVSARGGLRTPPAVRRNAALRARTAPASRSRKSSDSPTRRAAQASARSDCAAPRPRLPSPSPPA